MPSAALTLTLGAAEASTRTSPFAAPANAVTVDVCVVVNCERASPLASVIADVGLKVPFAVTNWTLTPGSGLLSASNTSAAIVTVPPLCDTLDGVADIEMVPDAAAAPTLIVTPLPLALPEPVRAPPEKA